MTVYKQVCSSRRRCLGAAMTLLVLVLLMAGSARAGVANGGIPGASPGNPLAGLPWGNYSGALDEVFPAYRAAQGDQRRLLARIALRPRMRWFGAWYRDAIARRVAREYIDNVTGGRSDVLAQMAVFRVDPWEHAACDRLPSSQQQASYWHWTDAFADGIGSSRVALVLQPDLPFLGCVPNHSRIPQRLVSYAARRFSQLPHTTVYIDAGAGDWAGVGETVSMLRAAGIRYARGFALNSTHYDSTEQEIRFGRSVISGLARAGIGGRHFVINTASNGRPFTYQQYHHSNFDNANVCRSRSSRVCVTLGIPPTADVANPRWGLSGSARSTASRLVDAFLWIGRPWLYNQADPFDLQRSLQLARSTPF